MGVTDRLMNLLFGSGRNVIVDTAEFFSANAEAQSGRDSMMHRSALAQFGGEFEAHSDSRFDRIIDGLNRLPRPLLAFGTIALFVSAMVEPVWFAARMQGIALVPEPLWWLLGAIISFYFGSRHQAKGQAFQRQMLQGLSRLPTVQRNINTLETGALGPGQADTATDSVLSFKASRAGKNPALNDWRADGGFQGR